MSAHIEPPEEAEKLSVEQLDSDNEWQRHDPEGWAAAWSPEDEWPDSDDLKEWASIFGALEPGTYRCRWTPSDRRRVIELGPVVAVADLGGGARRVWLVDDHPTATAPPAGTPAPFPSGTRNPATAKRRPAATTPEAAATPALPPYPAPPAVHHGAPSGAPPQSHMASLAPVLSPAMTPEMADKALQQFLIIQQLSAQQSDRFVSHVQAMATAMIQASAQNTQVLLETLRTRTPAPPPLDVEHITERLGQRLAPLEHRLAELDEDEDDDPAELLAKLAEAQQQQPRSFLEQLTGFLATPAGAALAQMMQQRIAQAASGGAPPPPAGSDEPVW